MDKVINIVYAVLAFALLFVIADFYSSRDDLPSTPFVSSREYYDKEDGSPGTGSFYSIPYDYEVELAAKTRFDYINECREITYDDYMTLGEREKIKLVLEVVSIEYTRSYYFPNGNLGDESYQLVGIDSTGAYWSTSLKRNHVTLPVPTEMLKAGDTVTIYGFVSDSQWDQLVDGKFIRMPSVILYYIETEEGVFSYR